MNNRVTWIVSSILLIVILLAGVAACTSPAPTTPSTPAAPAAPSAPAAAKTLPIGLNITLNWPLGIDMKHALEWDVEKINNAGGLDIGGQKYLPKLMFDDNKMDQALTKTAAQKEIFQDGCKFIIVDKWCQSIFPLVEENKIITFQDSSDFDSFKTKWNYLWAGSIGESNYPIMVPYCARKFPNLKTFVGAYPDRQDGHIFSDVMGNNAKKSGLTVLENQFYPPAATDLSAVGTKIKSMNPDILLVIGGGPGSDSMALKAAQSAGWKGQVLAPTTAPGMVLAAIAGPAAVEGMLGYAWAQEFEPALTPMAKEYKDYYKAKFGKWDDPEVVQANMWWVLKAALLKAASTDVAKVKPVLDSGLEYLSLCGDGIMMPRYDQGNSRTVDALILNLPVKQVIGGQLKLVEVMNKQQSIDLFNSMYGK